MIILSCNNLTKYFGVDIILEKITFSLQAGERVGLVGVNGAGKSTLFKILTGQLPYDTGDLFIAKTTSVGYLEQSGGYTEGNTILDEALTVYTWLIEMENSLRRMELEIADLSDSNNAQALEELMNQYSTLLEKFDRNNGYGFRSTVRGVLKGLGFQELDFQQPVAQLSGGEKTRLSLAKLLLSKPDILLLDEPTNHLDIEAVEWLEGFLRDYSGTVLLISHDRYFLDQLVTRVLEIERHQLISYNGNYSEFVQRKRIMQEQQLREYQNNQKEIERQKDIIRRLRQHGTEKLINRAKSREKQLSKLEIVESPQHMQKKAKISFHSQNRSGNDVLQVEALGKNFSDFQLFENVSFDLYRGERAALIGPNGIGKSTLFKMLLEETDISSGTVQIGHNVEIGYYDQEQRNLNPDNTIINEIWEDYPLMKETEVRTLLGSFLFHDEEVFKSIASLSGGEKARLSLLKLILSKSNLLLLDEPTNHLDILAKEVLEEALLNYDGTILVISHDRYFLNRISSKIIELGKEGSDIYLGNYDYYYAKKKELEESLDEMPAEEKTKTQQKEDRRREKEEKNRLKERKANRDRLEASIMQLEEDLTKLQEDLCKEEIYANPDKSKEVNQEITTLQIEIENLYAEWESAIDIE